MSDAYDSTNPWVLLALTVTFGIRVFSLKSMLISSEIFGMIHLLRDLLSLPGDYRVTDEALLAETT